MKDLILIIFLGLKIHWAGPVTNGCENCDYKVKFVATIETGLRKVFSLHLVELKMEGKKE